MNITRLNEILKELPGEVDLSKKDELTAEMRYGLAQAYSNKGFRDYLELAIRQASDAFDSVEDINGHLYVKSKKITLKNLLFVCKNHFEQVQKIEKGLKGK